MNESGGVAAAHTSVPHMCHSFGQPSVDTIAPHSSHLTSLCGGTRAAQMRDPRVIKKLRDEFRSQYDELLAAGEG